MPGMILTGPGTGVSVSGRHVREKSSPTNDERNDDGRDVLRDPGRIHQVRG